MEWHCCRTSFRQQYCSSVYLSGHLFCRGGITGPSRNANRRRSRRRCSSNEEAQNAAIRSAIRERGLMAFTEPMTDPEELYLELYISSASQFTPAELTEASEHYQNPKIMIALAQKPNCPVDSLVSSPMRS